MAANDYFNSPINGYSPYRRPGNQAPSLPPLQYSALTMDHQLDSPVSPTQDSTPLYEHPGEGAHERYFGAGSGGRRVQDEESPGYYPSSSGGRLPSGKRQHSDEIPLRDNPQQYNSEAKRSSPTQQQAYAEGENLPPPAASGQGRRRAREPEKKGFWAGKIPWVVYFLTLVQLSVFIAELVKNCERIHPSLCSGYRMLIVS